MKKVLLASTALVLSAGVAAADVTVSGDGRMGILQTFGGDAGFTSRIRIAFSASGETDGGLSFGGSIRADNAGGFNIVDSQGNTLGDDAFSLETNGPGQITGGGGVLGQAGDVFIEGGFGKLSMGDVDGAAKAAVGHVSGVGLTGLGDLNEVTYIANVGPQVPGVLYEYAGAGFGIYLSASNPISVFTGTDTDLGGNSVDVAYAIGADYSGGIWSVAAGYENNGAGTDHFIIGGTVSTGGFTGKLIYGNASGNVSGDQWGISGDYTFGATTLTAFYTDDSDLGGVEGYGLGVAYDLGGGASVKAGYANNETGSRNAWDLGLNFSF